MVVKGHEGGVNSTAVSPNGRRFATASEDRSVRVWDIGKKATMIRLDGHESGVARVAFAPDGRHLLTLTRDGAGRLWHIFPSTQALVSYAVSLVPTCLTVEQRKTFFLDPESPLWCRDKTGNGNEQGRADGADTPASSN